MFSKSGWVIRVFCQDICVIYDAKGREICKTPDRETAEYILELNRKSNEEQKR